MNERIGNTQKPHRVAIIGAGKISEEHLRFLQDSPLTQMVGVCDLSPALAKYASESYSAGKPYTDHRQMIAETKPDVVHVLTPPQSHVMLIRECLEANSHVIAEKPITPDRASFLELRQLAEQRGRLLIEDHNYRFNEPVKQIDRLIEQGALGKVKDVEIRVAIPLRSPGGRYADKNMPAPSHQMPCGAIHEFITHMSYLLLHYMQDFDNVSAWWHNHGGGDLFKFDDLDAIVLNEEIHGRLRFSCMTNPDTFSIVVRGTRGWVSTDLYQPHLQVIKPRKGGAQLSPLMNHLINGCSLTKACFVGFKDKVLHRKTYEGLHRFLNLTYQHLDGKGDVPVEYGQIDKTLALIEALTAAENQFGQSRQGGGKGELQ